MPGRRRKDSGRPRGSKPFGTGDSVGFRARGRSNLLESAAGILADRFEAGADEPWTPERFQVALDRELKLLEGWADLEQLGRMEPGGKEHDLFPAVEAGRRIFKLTKGNGFGWHPICDRLFGTPSDEFQLRLGTPGQYLRRLILVNQLFPGLNRLDGFVHVHKRMEIVTSQPFVSGRNATLPEIRNYLDGLGFANACNTTWFRDADNLAVFDAAEPNILVSDGHIVPVDIIPLCVSGYFLRRMTAAASKLP